MYKKQMRFQRFACLFAVLSAALWFVYSLGIMTEIYDSLYFTMQNPDDLSETLVPGSILYYDMQGFNRFFLYAAIGLVLLACLLFLTNTHTRRRYYIGNALASGLFCAASVAVAVWSHLQIESFKAQFLTTVDFDALQMWAEIFPGIVYSRSTLLLDLHMVVAGAALLAVALVAINFMAKLALMRAENALIENGKGAAA